MKKTLLFYLLTVMSVSGVCLAQSGQASNVFNADTAHCHLTICMGLSFRVLKPITVLLSAFMLRMHKKCRFLSSMFHLIWLKVTMVYGPIPVNHRI